MAVLTRLSVPLSGGERGTLMPKLQNRFRVTFDFDTSQFVTSNAISATRPNLTHDEVQVDAYNSRIYLAGKHTWDPVSITLRDDVNGTTLKQVNDQIQRQIDMQNQSSPLAGAGYKFVATVESLDGGNDNPFVLDAWELQGAYIQNVQYGENNYSSSEPTIITLSLRYDNALLDINNPTDPPGATL